MKHSINLMIATALLMVFSLTAHAELEKSDTLAAKRALLEFYTAYTTAVVNDGSAKSALLIERKFLTRSALKQMEKLIEENDCDPLIRAQDFTREGISTLRAKAHPNDWYTVSWFYDYNKEWINIEVQVKLTRKGYKLTRIK